MLSHLFQSVLDWLEAFLMHHWERKTVLVSIASLLLFSCPSPSKLAIFSQTNPNYPFLTEQIQHPLIPQAHPPASHVAKRTFRLFMPLIGHLTGVSAKGLIVVQYAWGILFFVFLPKLVYRYSKDKISSFLFTLGMSALYVGKAFVLDYWAFFDGTAFFFLLLSLYFRTPWMLFVCLSCAFWTDERALAASVSIAAFHLLVSYFESRDNKTAWRISPIVTIVAALSVYAVLRCYLHSSYELTMGTEAMGISWALQKYYRYMPFAIFQFLESYWFLVLFAFFYLASLPKRNGIFLSVLFLIGICMQCGAALSVGDMIRSGAYLFIACLSAFVVISSLEPNLFSIRKLMVSICIMAFLIPTYSNFGGRLIWMKPDLLLYNLWGTE